MMSLYGVVSWVVHSPWIGTVLVALIGIRLLTGLLNWMADKP
jgi:hypothetical protein